MTGRRDLLRRRQDHPARLGSTDGPPPVLTKNVDEGSIDFKTKRGFLEWDDQSIAKERARYEHALRKCLEICREEGIL